MAGTYVAPAPVYPDPTDDAMTCFKKFAVLFGQIHAGIIPPFPTR